MNTFECINIIGLTGQSGAGKTTVSVLFAENGFAVIDADKVSREVAKFKPFLDEVAIYFPDCVSDSGLDRQKLAGIVFNDKAELDFYTSLIYPYITTAVFNIIKEYKNCGETLILLDAPTLFESGLDDICDAIVSVTAPLDMMIERIIERDGISRELAKSRLSSQHSAAWFIDRCDYNISNDGELSKLEASVNCVINDIKERFNA